MEVKKRKLKDENEKLILRIIEEMIFSLRQMRKSITEEREFSKLLDENFLSQRMNEMKRPLENYKQSLTKGGIKWLSLLKKKSRY